MSEQHARRDVTTETMAGYSRRQVLQGLAAVAGASALGASGMGPSGRGAGQAVSAAEPEKPKKAVPLPDKIDRIVRHGRIQQSLAHWCFKDYWTVEEMAVLAKSLGCVSIELIPPEHWPILKKHGLVCAIASSHGFVKGFNNPENWGFCIERIQKTVDACAAFGFPNVITFTGMREKLSDEEGLKNCVAGLKKVVGYAEQNKVTLCLEMLNTRDSSHPMKGHPGYQGDHTDYCMEIIRQVGSPRLKLLFDIYHVQIMDGDVIRRIHQLKEYLGHIHTAGNPGRGELDDKQEIHYPAVLRALVEVGYKGYVGHEYIPTRDPLVGLKEAVGLSDV